MAGIVLATAFPSSAVGQAELSGEWVGSLRSRAETLYVRLNLAGGGADDLSASVLSSQPRPLTVAAARAADSTLALTLVGGRDTFDLRGTWAGDTVTGSMTARQSTGTFMLLRIAQVNPALYDEYAGGYELEPGRMVFVRRGDRLASKAPFVVERSWLQFVESTGRTRLLFPSSQSEFFAGSAYTLPAPVTLRVKFVRDGSGRVTGMHWREANDTAEVYAARTNRYRAEEVRFASGDVSLAGRLLIPAGPGPHPGVVLLPGGPGPSNRNDNYFAVADLLSAAGFATLAFEKRGNGASMGDWRRASYADLAGDAVAAVQFLRRRPDLDARCVGLWGISESGWIAPLAARASSDVAFVAVVGASGLPHADLDLALLDRALRAEGALDSVAFRAIALERSIVEYARTRRNWRNTRAALDTIRAASWGHHSIIGTHTSYDFPVSEDHWFWSLYSADAGYDPLPALRELRVPLLAVWGEFDPAAPPDLNVPSFERARAGRSDSAFRLVVVPRGDHVLWEFPTANTSNFHLVRRFVPEYFDMLRTWFAEQAASCALATR